MLMLHTETNEENLLAFISLMDTALGHEVSHCCSLDFNCVYLIRVDSLPVFCKCWAHCLLFIELLAGRCGAVCVWLLVCRLNPPNTTHRPTPHTRSNCSWSGSSSVSRFIKF